MPSQAEAGESLQIWDQPKQCIETLCQSKNKIIKRKRKGKGGKTTTQWNQIPSLQYLKGHDLDCGYSLVCGVPVWFTWSQAQQQLSMVDTPVIPALHMDKVSWGYMKPCLCWEEGDLIKWYFIYFSENTEGRCCSLVGIQVHSVRWEHFTICSTVVYHISRGFLCFVFSIRTYGKDLLIFLLFWCRLSCNLGHPQTVKSKITYNSWPSG